MKTEQYLCQSYYDQKTDSIVDCTCGKCKQAHEITEKRKTQTIIVHDEEDFSKTHLVNFKGKKI